MLSWDRRQREIGRALRVLLMASAWTLGCGGGGASPVAPPPPPPPSPISVSVTPTSAAVLLGNTQNFSAEVVNATNTQVTWSVNGIAGGNANVGMMATHGQYTAPADLPSPASVEIRATSQADPAKSASAQVTVTSDISLSVAPGAASVELGAIQAFRASLVSNGHPDSAVRWNLAGAACPANCGAIDASGNYTAPQIMPTFGNVTVNAQSVADPSKHASANVTITSNFALNVTAPGSVAAGSSTSITATLQPVAGSNPSTALSWTLAGAGCTGAACGTLTGATIQSVGSALTATTAYTAPNTPPNPNSVTITVTPQADPSRIAQATLTILPGSSGVSVTLSPVSATRATSHRLTLSAQVSGTNNSTLNWSVNGVAGGNATLGQICVAGSSPCQTVTASSAAQVDYLAPGAIPLPNPVTVQAASQADPTANATVQIAVIAHIQVTVLPASVTLAPGAVQAFTASVLGTGNQDVVWEVQGAACAGSSCGLIDANGIYTAPPSAPAPNGLQVEAISSEDTTQTGAANVSISSGANIQKLLPASVYAGGTAGFTVKVEGSGFAPSSPGPGSSLEITGTARTTACSSANECTAPMQPTDVAVAGNISVQVLNPDGTPSNQVVLVVLAPSNVDEVIALNAASPSAGGRDIVVVEPTTAGADLPGDTVDLNVAAMGVFSTANNSCTLAGNPVVLVRPASGTATADLCLFSASGLDASMSYTVSGPGDIAVIAKQPAGLGIIHVTLQIASSALPGARSLFIQNANLDKTAGGGALEVE